MTEEPLSSQENSVTGRAQGTRGFLALQKMLCPSRWPRTLQDRTDCTFSSPNLEITKTLTTSFQNRRDTYCHHHGREMQCQSQMDVIIMAKMKWKAQEARRGGYRQEVRLVRFKKKESQKVGFFVFCFSFQNSLHSEVSSKNVMI